MNAAHLRDYVVIPTLRYLDPEVPYSDVAVALLMGTAAQESKLQWLAQLGGGPALGLWQMEPATYRDIWNKFLVGRTLDRQLLNVKLTEMMTGRNTEGCSELIGNLNYAAAMCRVHYFRIREALPHEANPALLGRYWKQYYNTPKGKGTVEEFVESYRLVAGGA